jgi:hypothetical protein
MRRGDQRRRRTIDSACDASRIHGAMVISMAPATCGQARFRIGREKDREGPQQQEQNQKSRGCAPHRSPRSILFLYQDKKGGLLTNVKFTIARLRKYAFSQRQFNSLQTDFAYKNSSSRQNAKTLDYRHCTIG